MATPHRTHDNNHSSLFDKLPEDIRRQLDLAIVHRIPPTFKDVWMQFELAKYGVSFSALYRYARRLRDRINVAEAVLLADDDPAELDDAIQKLLSRRLIEILLHTGGASCAKEIAAITSAQRKGAKTTVDLRRLEHDRESLRLKGQFLELARQRQLKLLDNAADRPATEPNPVDLVNPVHSQDAQPLRLACSNDSGVGACATEPAPDSPATVDVLTF